MYITKKELLEETGISYGQLYRWKREGLIPEEWFIKRPSRTGQETLLPKEKVMERIAFIQNNKHSCSLDEMAGMFRMKAEDKEFNKELLSRMVEIHPHIVRAVADGEYSRAEIAFLAIISAVYQKYGLNRSEAAELLSGCAGHFTDMVQGRHVFCLYKAFGHYVGVVIPEGAEMLTDKRMVLAERYQVEEIASKLAMKYLAKEEEQ